MAGEAANLNRFLLVGLLLTLVAGFSIQLVTGSGRDLIVKAFIGLFVLFMAFQYFLGIDTALLVLVPLVLSVSLFAVWRGRRDYVLGCTNDPTI